LNLNGSVKEDITERIKNAGKCYQLVRGILWKQEMHKKGKTYVYLKLHVHIKLQSRNSDMDQGRY
jgi:hypothetical protein